jgi:hypothetical protein
MQRRIRSGVNVSFVSCRRIIFLSKFVIKLTVFHAISASRMSSEHSSGYCATSKQEDKRERIIFKFLRYLFELISLMGISESRICLPLAPFQPFEFAILKLDYDYAKLNSRRDATLIKVEIYRVPLRESQFVGIDRHGRLRDWLARSANFSSSCG